MIAAIYAHDTIDPHGQRARSSDVQRGDDQKDHEPDRHNEHHECPQCLTRGT